MKNIEIIEEKTKALLDSNVCSELKEASENWLKNKNDNELYDKLISTAQACVMKIDDVINFFKSEKGISLFGSEKAAAIVSHGEEIKSKGEIYCDCPACTLAREIIEYSK